MECIKKLNTLGQTDARLHRVFKISNTQVCPNIEKGWARPGQAGPGLAEKSTGSVRLGRA